MAEPKTYTYYHAGPLFTLAELHTNTLLAAKIHEISGGKFIPIVPQDLEQRDTTPHSIRDEDIRSLVACDLALFTYDGAELDAGTVVEYMISKFADMPAVILRSDFRTAGDQDGKGDAWNLMSSFWPRTSRVVVNSMMGYKTGLAQAMGQDQVEVENASALVGGRAALRAGEGLLDETARRVVAAMEEVIKEPSRMPKEAREHVFGWLGMMPGFKAGGDEGNVQAMLDLMKRKQEKGLM